MTGKSEETTDSSAAGGRWTLGVDTDGDGAMNVVFKSRGGVLAALTAVVVAFVALDLLVTGGETIRALVP